MRLHLVRHGRSAMDPDRLPSTWGLHSDAGSGIGELAGSGVLPATYDDGCAWFSSSEPKAVQTAARLGAEALPVAGLHEAVRPLEWLGPEEFVTTVTRSMQTPDVPARLGWETATDVSARLLEALRHDVAPHVDLPGVDEVVLVGHGTAWTLLVSSLTGAPADVRAWQGMTMPDHCLLECPMALLTGESPPADAIAGAPAPRGRVLQPWGGWRSTQP